ncbi:MAG: hypothetical protein R2762_04980 [Bryobacteraceae bacterium]
MLIRAQCEGKLMANHLNERTLSSFQQLSAAASEPNKTSDELGNLVSDLDGALKRLNLGVSTWVMIDRFEDSNSGTCHGISLGYDRINRQWGISIQSYNGNSFAEDHEAEYWHFNEAPRSIRLKAVERIPDLQDARWNDPIRLTADLKKTALARELATAIGVSRQSAKPKN